MGGTESRTNGAVTNVGVFNCCAEIGSENVNESNIPENYLVKDFSDYTFKRVVKDS